MSRSIFIAAGLSWRRPFHSPASPITSVGSTFRRAAISRTRRRHSASRAGRSGASGWLCSSPAAAAFRSNEVEEGEEGDGGDGEGTLAPPPLRSRSRKSLSRLSATTTSFPLSVSCRTSCGDDPSAMPERRRASSSARCCSRADRKATDSAAAASFPCQSRALAMAVGKHVSVCTWSEPGGSGVRWYRFP